MKKGFTLVEIIIVVGLVLVLASLAIPNLLRARLQANEANAQATLKSIASAEIAYHDSNFVYGTLSNLGNPANAPSFLDTVFDCVTEPCNKSGYSFTSVDNTVGSFAVVAQPTIPNTSGVRTFCITEDGTIRGQTVADSDIDSREKCLTLNITQP